MKKYILLLIAIAFFECSPNVSKEINQTKTAYSERCDGVTSLAWQEQIQGADAETTAKLVTNLTTAAEVDAKKSENLQGSGSVNFDIKSELAKVINQNVTQSSKVDEDFWEQENRLGESLCLFVSLLDRKDLNDTQKSVIVDDIRKLVVAYNDYTLNKKKNPTIGIDEIKDLTVYFTINNNADIDLNISKMYLEEVVVTDAHPFGDGLKKISREDLGLFALDAKDNQIVLTDPNMLLRIEKHQAVPFKFKYLTKNLNFVMETNNSSKDKIVGRVFLMINYYNQNNGQIEIGRLKAFLFNRVIKS